MGDLQFDLRGGSELKEISRQLRKVSDGKEIRKRFARELRAVGKPMVPKVRASIRAIPTTGDRHTGLRKRLARATRLIVKTSGRSAQVTVMVDGRKMPPGERALPAYMEGTKKPWRHPVHGTDEWVKQEPHPYFRPVFRGMGRQARRAVNRVIGSITTDILKAQHRGRD